MRRVLVVAAVLACLALGLVQVACDAAFGMLAEPASVPGWLSRTVGIDLLVRIDRLAPTAWSTATLAEAALVRGDSERARAAIARMPASARRDDLDARLALAQGNDARAIAEFLAAGDANAVLPIVAQRAARGDLARAIALADTLVARLRADASHPANYVDALIVLGALHERRAARSVGRAQAAEWERALGAYTEARALQPIDVTILLGIGDVESQRGNRARAHAAYLKAARLDPRDERARTRAAETT